MLDDRPTDETLSTPVPAATGGSGTPTSKGAEDTHLEAAPSTVTLVSSGVTPERIGAYRILQTIGEGGMGTVYLAEQTEPVRRRVALKLIKLGMDTKQVVARFEAERQALAMMNHASIAAVYDAGATEQGRPFFIMEYVAGVPITVYCDKHKLSLTDRLELFIQVCQAIQHAHTKSIIHRDIKSSNILVTLQDGKPVPKIIDFGIAKATNQRLTEETVFTEHGQLIGTPAYMSPEQAEMSQLDIDTRTDIYSLGVLLYELLTGTLPFDPQTLRRAAYGEIQRIIREVDPPKPSARLSQLVIASMSSQAGVHGEKSPAIVSGATIPSGYERNQRPSEMLSKLAAVPSMTSSLAAIAADRLLDPKSLVKTLRGDLDWIVMKCLEKDRSRRYETANALGVELRRYLTHEPVLAGPPSAAYRVRKFIRRNRGGVFAVSAILAAVFLGLIGTSIGFLQARLQRNRAVSAEQDQRRLRHQAEEARDAELLARKSETAAKNEAVILKDAAVSKAYVANLIAADASLEANEPARVLARLKACPEKMRNWEWGFLDARSDHSLFALHGHKNPVRSATFSPDGTRITTASDDSTAAVWEASTGLRIAELRGHTAVVGYSAFSPDGTRIVTASADGTARVWDSANGNLVAKLSGHKGEIRSAMFSRDGLLVVTASRDHTARVFDSSTGSTRAVLMGHTGDVFSAAFNPDCSRVVTASDDKSVRVWDSATGVQVHCLRPKSVASMRHDSRYSGMHSAEYSPDGGRIVAAFEDNTTRLWNSESGEELAILRGHTGDVYRSIFSRDGSRVLTASSDCTARVWDAATGEEVANLHGHQGALHAAAFSPDGARIVTSSYDRTARVWDANTGQSIAVLRGHLGEVWRAEFSPDSKRIVTASFDRTARVWDAGMRSEITTLRGHQDQLWSVEFSRDGKRVTTASQDKTARVWDASSGAEIVMLRGHTSRVWTATFSSDGTRIVTASDDGTAREWDSSSGSNTVVFSGHKGQVLCARFSPDGTRVVTASNDRTSRIWDRASGSEISVLRGHEDEVWSASFSPDSKSAVTASWDGSARTWDVATGHQQVVMRGHEGKVFSAVFNSDGSRIVTASDDKTARIWETATGIQIAVLRGHDDLVFSARFSPDGTRIVTSSWDCTARVWDTATCEELAILHGHERVVQAAAFSPDGLRIISGGFDGTARIFDSVPYRIRYAERSANARGEDGDVVVRAYIHQATSGRETWTTSQPVTPKSP